MKNKHTSIQEEILHVLEKGPVEKSKLLEKIISSKGCTPQGFYKTLTQLWKDEVITIHKKTISLSFFWIQNELNRISRIATTYQAPVYQSYFGMLKERDRVSYRFKTLRELELFWVHAVLITVESNPDTHILSLTPHDWFQNLRPDINVWWRKTTTGHPHWAILTHATSKEMQRTHYSDVKLFERMANINPLKQKESTYINIVDNLIFEAQFDERIIPGIRSFMEESEINPAAILDFEGVYKLTIMRNSKKSKMIENKLKKYFSVSLYSTHS